MTSRMVSENAGLHTTIQIDDEELSSCRRLPNSYGFYTRRRHLRQQIYGLRIYRSGHEYHDTSSASDEPGAARHCGRRSRPSPGRLFRCHPHHVRSHATRTRLDAAYGRRHRRRRSGRCDLFTQPPRAPALRRCSRVGLRRHGNTARHSRVHDILPCIRCDVAHSQKKENRHAYVSSFVDRHDHSNACRLQ